MKYKFKCLILTLTLSASFINLVNANGYDDEVNRDKNNLGKIYNYNLDSNTYTINKTKKFNISYKNIDKSFDTYIYGNEKVEGQKDKLAIIHKNGKFQNANFNEIKEFANPKSDLDYGKMYQYMRLDKYRNIDLGKLNSYLNNLKINNGNINIFEDKADGFVTACKQFNIDPLYLVSHTLLESGNGQSALAQGYEVELDENGEAVRYEYRDKTGNLVYDKNGNTIKYVKLKDENTPEETQTIKVYNLFGIGAVDSAPTAGGTTTAYNNGWTSIDKAIEGAAKWISDNYINSSKYTHQNNLYSMKWDYINGWHQYATDVEWAQKIGTLISKIDYMYIDSEIDLEIPVYKHNHGWIKQKNNEWIYIDDNCNMQLGWLYNDYNWYYFGNEGNMQVGWQLIDNNWYYFDSNGKMKSNCIIDGWKLDSNGVGKPIYHIGWIWIGNAWYYFANNYEMQTGWQWIDNAWYYLGDNGMMQTGWQWIDNAWYYLGDNGMMQTGWQWIDNDWYYLGNNGIMVTNEVVDGWIIGNNGIANLA